MKRLCELTLINHTNTMHKPSAFVATALLCISIATYSLYKSTTRAEQATSRPVQHGVLAPVLSSGAQLTATAAIASQPAAALVAPRPLPTLSRREIDALELDRELSGSHKVSYDDRQRSVLGTKQITGQNSTQTVLLVRDDSSGQIDYWQSGLQFELRPGVDYEKFIQSRSALTRRFVNVVYAQVTVDAGDIALEYAALSADPRVLRVGLLPIATPMRAR